MVSEKIWSEKTNFQQQTYCCRCCHPYSMWNRSKYWICNTSSHQVRQADQLFYIQLSLAWGELTFSWIKNCLNLWVSHKQVCFPAVLLLKYWWKKSKTFLFFEMLTPLTLKYLHGNYIINKLEELFAVQKCLIPVSSSGCVIFSVVTLSHLTWFILLKQ